MKYKRILAGILLFSFLLSIAGCTISSGKNKPRRSRRDRDDDDFWETLVETVETEFSEPVNTITGTIPTDTDPTVDYGDISDLTMFICQYGSEIDDYNDIQDLIAEKTGVKLHESWLTGMTASEAVGAIMASGQYPDLIYAKEDIYSLYENEALVIWDDYLEMYPNLKEMYSDEEWDAFRMSDGHIYWAGVLDNHYKNADTNPNHAGQAFWIQTRVLEWANYPKISTLDEYFDLIEAYCEANPTMPNGTPNIGFTAQCDSWKYFGLENPPMFLDGYPNNGCCNVNGDDPSNPYVIDYNTTDTAKRYFSKLNEMYNKGIMYQDFFDQDYDSYIEMLKTGAVLGLSDGYWDFYYNIADVFYMRNDTIGGISLYDLGCGYVPLGLTIDAGMDNRWHDYGDEIDPNAGIGVTLSTQDPDLCFYFLSSLLDQDIHDLRFWGIEGEDYLVDENGYYYRTESMRENWKDPYYLADHCCPYSYCPQWKGISRDGKNAMMPCEQPDEYLASLPSTIADCFRAYGVWNYVGMIDSVHVDIVDKEPWYPLWSWSNMLTNSTDAGVAWSKMGECKHQWLPTIIMSRDFESDWKAYIKAYEECDPEDFLEAAQMEVDMRMGY